jgi:hypothetical protein
MATSKKYLLCGAAVIWALLIIGSALLVFFPYQKTLRIVFEDVTGGPGNRISFVGARGFLTKATAQKIIVGHEALEGSSLYEVEKVSLTWNPLSIVTGGFDMKARAFAYGGTVDLSVTGMPLFSNSVPKLKAVFTGINLGSYPEGVLPWFGSAKGIMSGTITKEVRFVDSAEEKGSFHLTLRDGEFKDVSVIDGPDISLPFKEAVIAGKIMGNTWEIEKVFLKSGALIVRGSGAISKPGRETAIDMKFVYESPAGGNLPTGTGTITVSGALWSPEVAVVKEGGSRSVSEFEKSAFFKKFKAKSMRSEPLKSGGTGFTYVYQDRESKDEEAEVLLAPDPEKIESVRISWRSKQPLPAPRFTGTKEEFLKELLLSLDSKMDADGVVSYVANQHGRKYPEGESTMPKENIGNIVVRAGVAGLVFIAVINFQP